MTTVVGDVIPKVGPFTDTATVKAVQDALTARGFKPTLGSDGIWGKYTQEALRSWQYESGLEVTGVIDYGVLLALGIPAPGAAASAATTTAEAVRAKAVADATAKERAKVDADRAAAAVDVAKTKVATAPTPQAKQTAERELGAAQQKLEVAQAAVVPAGLSWWQYALIGLGTAAIGVGAWSLTGSGKGKRKGRGRRR